MIHTEVTNTIMKTSRQPKLLEKLDAYWRAANYLSVGQIYLYDNPLLKQPLTRAHIKPRLLGHWGTTPGLNFIYVHLNRIIKQYDLNMIYLAGPGHGGPAMVANTCATCSAVTERPCPNAMVGSDVPDHSRRLGRMPALSPASPEWVLVPMPNRCR